MKKKILVTATNYSMYCSKAKALLEKKGFEIIENNTGNPMTFEQLKPLVNDVFGVIAGVETWNEDLFNIAPGLKIISRFGVGVDNIDLITAKNYGIKVTNASGANADSVGEYTVALILAVLRNIVFLDRSTREGHWERFMGHTIRGKKVGLIGFGAVAQYVAGLLYAFQAQLYAYDKKPNLEAAKRYGVTFTDFTDIMSNCDIISLHVPCNKETINMITEEQFNMMKNTSILINTARGPIIDENALYIALRNKKIAGAGLDVFYTEPTSPQNPLFHLDNIIVMPHTAAETYETYHAVSMITAQAIIDFTYGKQPLNLLNNTGKLC